MMRHIDLMSPEMVSAEMTRADIEAAIAVRQRRPIPSRFTGKTFGA